MAQGWTVEVVVLDPRVGHPTGRYWLKCAEAGQIAGTAYGASRGAKYHAWTRAQAQAVAKRQASIMAQWANGEPGQNVSVMRDPDGDAEGNVWEVLEERGSIGQDVEPIAVCTALQTRYATGRYGGNLQTAALAAANL